MSFKFDFDDPPYQNREVVYIYEIHLHQRLRGQGIGSDLFKFVELAAKRSGIGKTMLTVFTANEKARRMYEKAGYVKDECSPPDRMMRNKVIKAEYVIMSKELA
jgi:GNAT superfamily N-acetyltransferase